MKHPHRRYTSLRALTPALALLAAAGVPTGCASAVADPDGGSDAALQPGSDGGAQTQGDGALPDGQDAAGPATSPLVGSYQGTITQVTSPNGGSSSGPATLDIAATSAGLRVVLHIATTATEMAATASGSTATITPAQDLPTGSSQTCTVSSGRAQLNGLALDFQLQASCAWPGAAPQTTSIVGTLIRVN